MATTAIELRDTATAVDIGRNETVRRARAAAGPVDEILESSRLADSTVPDGGYGWVVITGCSIITFWVSASPSSDFHYIRSIDMLGLFGWTQLTA